MATAQDLVPAVRILHAVTALALALGLSACQPGPDPIGTDSRPATRDAYELQPHPDNRGIERYNHSQAIRARIGDTIPSMAARAGVPAAELARHNGLNIDYRPREGELLALPRHSAGTRPIEDIAASAIFSSPIAPLEDQSTTADSDENFPRRSDVAAAELGGADDPDGRLVFEENQTLPVPQDGDRRSASTTVGGTAASGNGTTAPGSASPAPAPPSSGRPLPRPAETAGVPPSPDLVKHRTPQGATRKLLRPVEGSTLRGYSGKAGGNEGIDIAAPAGSAVRAAEDGEIALVAPSKTQENIVLIRHADNLYTVYSRITDIAVGKGDTVARGDTIGTVAQGDPSMLHFQVRRGTESIDPAPYF